LIALNYLPVAQFAKRSQGNGRRFASAAGADARAAAGIPEHLVALPGRVTHLAAERVARQGDPACGGELVRSCIKLK
jgi:hypothetical protein